MVIREVLDQEKTKYDAVVKHPLQSWAWGEFKQASGAEVLRLGAFDGPKLVKGYQFTIHKIPQLGWKIGYLPKADTPNDSLMYAVRTAARIHNLIHIKIEPNTFAPIDQATKSLKPIRDFLLSNGCVVGKAMFTPYSFILDLRPSETDLLAAMKPKTRYNIKLSQKYGVQVSIDDSQSAFNEYLTLLKQTTKRQAFFSHDDKYHSQMWKYLSQSHTAHLMKATYQGKTLGIWVVFIFDQVLYYPYGASSRNNKEVMANNLLAWEAIRFGKQNYCHLFDMWGSLGPDADKNHPWYGFHRFKEGYGGTLVEFAGTYDFISDPQKYQIFLHLDKWRWKFLRFRAKLPF